MPRIVIPHSRNMKIGNVDQLGRGTGARYLEVILSPDNKVYIAKRWRKKLPTNGLFLDFKKK